MSVARLNIHVASILLLSASLVFAQENLPIALQADDVTIEQVDAAIAAVESLQNIDDNERTQVLDHLRAGQRQIQVRIDAELATQEFVAALQSAPEETARLQTSLDEQTVTPSAVDSFEFGDDSTLAELEQTLAQELADSAAIEVRLADLKAEIDLELARPPELQNQIGQLRRSRDSQSAIINTQPPPGELALLGEARRFEAKMTSAALSAELAKLDQELFSHRVRLVLLQTKRDVAARAALESAPRIELLRAAVTEKIQVDAIEAQRVADAAELAFADKHPVLQSLAKANGELTRTLPERAAATQALGVRLQKTKDELSNVEQRLARSEQLLEIGGLSRVLGSLMIAERRNLPPLSQYRAQIRARSRDAASIGLDRIRVQEQRRELASIDLEVQKYVVQIAEDVSDAAELEQYSGEIRELLRVRRDLLLQVENSYGVYLRVLGNIDIEQRRLLGSMEEYQRFLAKNLLWIPSAQVIGVGLAEAGLPDYPQFLSGESWSAVAKLLVSSVSAHVVESVLCLVALILLLLLRKPLARQYSAMSARVGRLSSDNIGLTVASLVIVCVHVLPVPFVLYSVSWFVANVSEPTAFSDTVARGLTFTTPFFFNVLLFRALSKPDGFLRLHFGWKNATLQSLRRQLDRLAFIGVPLLFATALLFLSDVESDRATIGRIAFIGFMLFLSSVIRPFLHPDTGLAAEFYKRNAGRWSARLRWVWFGLGVGLPLLLGVVSILGFLYTSTILVGLLVQTIWRMLGLAVIYLIILRWLALARRKLALQLAIKERDARRAEKTGESDEDSDSEVAPAIAEVPLDLEEVDQQTQKLLRSGFIFLAAIVGWNIWADVLPAFAFLNEVALWSQTATVDGVETVLPVTAADVVLALLIIVVTVIASRNIPGLLHILILQRLTLAPGSRYAITTLVRYLVVTIGTFAVLSLIGWNWSQIQWLVAALSVGLGFGLQEIVANFVSGLVILFERPVRVGDTVTVGQLTGTVSRVRIRATTITDWDRKEILVPNKAFITEQVINWTLSDPITRIVIPVGVAYGSDAELVQKVILKTLKKLPLVLDEPEPKVYFTEFGDSSLDFTLHAYLRQLSDRMPMVHDIHNAVLKALHENDIHIPFPQRDIHIRSTVESKD